MCMGDDYVARLLCWMLEVVAFNQSLKLAIAFNSVRFGVSIWHETKTNDGDDRKASVANRLWRKEFHCVSVTGTLQQTHHRKVLCDIFVFHSESRQPIAHC